MFHNLDAFGGCRRHKVPGKQMKLLFRRGKGVVVHFVPSAQPFKTNRIQNIEYMQHVICFRLVDQTAQLSDLAGGLPRVDDKQAHQTGL